MFDLHAGQIAGFFSNNLPVDNLYAEPYFIKFIQNNILTGIDTMNKNELIFVAPDAGAVKRNYRVSQTFGVDTCSIYKRRDEDGVIDHMMLIGDVQDKIVIMLDDMIDTGGTACKAAETLAENGALKIYMLASHGILSEPAVSRISNSKFEKVVVANTITPRTDVLECEKIEILDVSWLCAEAIMRQENGESLKELYQNQNILCENSIKLETL